MLPISKDRSVVLKGIVILMMLFLHLFNGHHTDLCTNIFYVSDEPLALWLSHACGPVGFFLLLSGYGLMYTYDHHRLTVVSQVRRVFRLYVHYWVVLLIFVGIGMWMKPTSYPGSFQTIVCNATGWSVSYNGEMWFLFPYMLVSLTSPYIFKLMERVGSYRFLFAVALLHIATCYAISRYGSRYLFDNMLCYHPILYVQFLYEFVLGAVLYQTKWKLDLHLPAWKTLCGIALLVVLVASYGNSVAYMLYVPLMVILLSSLPFPKWLERVLMELGRKSMPMWMIHTWFCYYLFQDQVYALKYPLLIFLWLIALSYFSATVVMWLTRHLLHR